MDKKYFECMTELGLEPGFNLSDLRKKWLELLKKYHPDKYQTEDESVIKSAEEKIIKINEAYEYLKENFLEGQEEDIDTMDYDYEEYTDDYSENKFWDKFNIFSTYFYVFEKDEYIFYICQFICYSNSIQKISNFKICKKTKCTYFWF